MVTQLCKLTDSTEHLKRVSFMIDEVSQRSCLKNRVTPGFPPRMAESDVGGGAWLV